MLVIGAQADVSAECILEHVGRDQRRDTRWVVVAFAVLIITVMPRICVIAIALLFVGVLFILAG